jgi:membrane protein DedA with SNARE-associated domain
LEDFLQQILTAVGLPPDLLTNFPQSVLEHPGFLYLLYPIILLWTFIEGETVVIVTGVLATNPKYNISVELLALFAFTGSFMGDQLYYYIGRRYGTPLLKRWPTLTPKIDWAFQLLKAHPTLFILSFRFIYGVRNVSPFIIGIAGVPRLRYFVLNFIAAQIWAHSFAWGGYLLGKKLEDWLGENRWYILGGFVLLATALGTWGYLAQKRKLRAWEAANPEQAAEAARVRVGETASSE